MRYLRPPWSDWHLNLSSPAGRREQRLRWAISQSIDVVGNGIGPGFAALLTDEDPEFSDVFRAIIATSREPAVAVLDVDHGDGNAVVDMIVGSYVAEFACVGTVNSTWTASSPFWATPTQPTRYPLADQAGPQRMADGNRALSTRLCGSPTSAKGWPMSGEAVRRSRR